MKDVIDADYKHANRVWTDFGRQNLGDYYVWNVPLDSLICKGQIITNT